MTSSIWDSGGIWTPGGTVWRTLGRCKCGGEEVCDEESRKEVARRVSVGDFHNNRSLHLSSMHLPFS